MAVRVKFCGGINMNSEPGSRGGHSCEIVWWLGVCRGRVNFGQGSAQVYEAYFSPHIKAAAKSGSRWGVGGGAWLDLSLAIGSLA